MGGPMMGFPLPDSSVAVVKGSNCILVRPVAKPAPAMPCIRCGSCASACPMQLLPQQLYWHARGRQLDKLDRYHLDSCIECACCSAVCPSHIPLVDYFRYAKSEIADQAYKRKRADESRLRNQQRNQRLEAERREAEERKAKRKAGRQRRAAPPADVREVS
jgi:electron transport complex protein RnfC